VPRSSITDSTGIAPATVTLLGDLYSGVLGTTAQGIRSSTGGMSLVVVPLVAGWLAGIGWKYPFYLYASAFLAVIFVYLYVPETAPEIGTDRRFRESLAAYKRSVKEEVRDVSLLVVMIGGFARFFSLFAFITFIPIFTVRSLGATPFEAGLVVALSGVRIALSPTAGWWVSRFSRRLTLLGTLAIQFGIFAVVPFVPNVWWLAGLAVLYGMGDSVFDPVVNDAVTSMVEDRNRNGIVGALRVLKEAGKTGAPIVLGGVLAIGGFTSMFASLAAVMACYGLAVLFVVRGGW
jgi:MFS family permease